MDELTRRYWHPIATAAGFVIIALLMSACNSNNSSPMDELDAIIEEGFALEAEALLVMRNYQEADVGPWSSSEYESCKAFAKFLPPYSKNISDIQIWYTSYRNEISQDLSSSVLERWASQVENEQDTFMLLTTTFGPCLGICRNLTQWDGTDDDPCIYGSIWNRL